MQARKQVFHATAPLSLGLAFEGDAPAPTPDGAPVAPAAAVAEPTAPVSQTATIYDNSDARSDDGEDGGDGEFGHGTWYLGHVFANPHGYFARPRRQGSGVSSSREGYRACLFRLRRGVDRLTLLGARSLAFFGNQVCAPALAASPTSSRPTAVKPVVRLRVASAVATGVPLLLMTRTAASPTLSRTTRRSP